MHSFLFLKSSWSKNLNRDVHILHRLFYFEIIDGQHSNSSDKNSFIDNCRIFTLQQLMYRHQSIRSHWYLLLGELIMCKGDLGAEYFFIYQQTRSGQNPRYDSLTNRHVNFWLISTWLCPKKSSSSPLTTINGHNVSNITSWRYFTWWLVAMLTSQSQVKYSGGGEIQSINEAVRRFRQMLEMVLFVFEDFLGNCNHENLISRTVATFSPVTLSRYR